MMTTAPPLSIAREATISFGINASLSLAFFIGVFGLVARPLAWGAHDGLALDFVPQSIAVALMSALVPALIARKRLGLAITIRSILIRAVGFAVLGAALGVMLAWVAQAAGLPPMPWSGAMILKLLYGGSLGAVMTTLTLRRMM